MKYRVYDGSYFLHRAIAAQFDQKLTNHAGIFTGGSFGFIRMLFNRVKEGKPLVVFDHSRPKFRTDLLPSYKQKDESNLRHEQKLARAELRNRVNLSIVQLKELLPKMGVPVVCVEGQEGDDIVYFTSLLLKNSGNEVEIVSDDTDYYGMCIDDLVIYRDLKKEHMTKADFFIRYGFSVDYYYLYLSLVGTHNSVPGIPGVGSKTAAKYMTLLENSKLGPTVDNLFETLKKEKQGKTVGKVLSNRDIIERNLKLIDFRLNPLDRSLVVTSYLDAVKNTCIDVDFVTKKFDEYEFNSLNKILINLRY